MNTSAIGIQNLFDLFGKLGTVIRNLFGQKVEVKGGMKVMLTLDLGAALEGLIRDIIAERKANDDPVEFFKHAVEELIKGNEQRLASLSQLNVADVTLGTEAIWNADAVPNDMRDIFVRYINLYTLAASPDEVADSHLLPPVVTDALQSWHDRVEDGSKTLVDEYGKGHIVPPRFDIP